MRRSSRSHGLSRSFTGVEPSAFPLALGIAMSLFLCLPSAQAQVSTNPRSIDPNATEPVDAQGATPDPPPFRIVIHRNNPIESLPVKALSRIFLKKTKRWDSSLWPGEVRVVPLDLEEKSEVRKKFTRAIHDKSTGAIKSYWQREIFSGRDVPPTEVETDEEMITRIVEEEGAIGYVSGTAELPEELKVLEVLDE